MPAHAYFAVLAVPFAVPAHAYFAVWQTHDVPSFAVVVPFSVLVPFAFA